MCSIKEFIKKICFCFYKNESKVVYYNDIPNWYDDNSYRYYLCDDSDMIVSDNDKSDKNSLYSDPGTVDL